MKRIRRNEGGQQIGSATKLLLPALMAGVALGLIGCQHLSGRPASIDLLQADPTGIEKELINLEAQFDAEADAALKRDLRDRFARKMIALTDKKYNEFLDALVGQRKGFDATSDIAAISLDAASVLFVPESTKSILAALSALTTASKTTINKVYFYEQTLPVVISQMSADRRTVLADIHAGLSLEVEKYRLYRLLSDLQRYYAAGTIDGALERIQQQAAQTAEGAEEAMRELIAHDVAAAKVRKTTALALASQQSSFDGLKASIGTWWIGLSEDDQFEQVDVILEYVGKHQIPKGSLVQSDGSPNPAGLGAFLDNLQHASQSHQLMLADFALNAVGLELP